MSKRNGKHGENGADGTAPRRESDDVLAMRQEMHELCDTLDEAALRKCFAIKDSAIIGSSLQRSMDEFDRKMSQFNKDLANSSAVPFNIHERDFELPLNEERLDHDRLAWSCKHVGVAMAALKAGFRVSIDCPPDHVAQGVSLILPLLDGKCRGYYEPGTRRLVFYRDNEVELPGVCSYCEREWGRDGCPCKCEKCRK